MSQNAFDSTGKLVVRLQPHAMLCWLSNRSPDTLRFHRWLDPHFPGQPPQPKRQSDLVAEMSRTDIVDRYWARNVEIQSDHDPDMPIRLEEYLVKIKRFLKPDTNRQDSYRVGSILVNLRGVSFLPEPDIDPDSEMHFEFRYRIINLCELDADTILQEIEAGQTPESVLAWIPLMQRGNEPDIIQRWIEIASNIPNNTLRSEIGGMVPVFAECADHLDVWQNALKGWNIMTSKVIEGWKQIGHIETLQNLIIRVASRQFGTSVAHASQIQQVTEADRLDRMFDAVSTLSSWDDLLKVT